MNSLASCADYADALLIARKAKNVALIVILIMLLGQVALFFTWKYSAQTPASTTSVPLQATGSRLQASGAVTPASTTTSVPTSNTATEETSLPTTLPAVEKPAPSSEKPQLIAHYLLALASFTAMIAAIVALVDMALILNIQLIGRLLGTAHIAKSFFLMLILTLMLFPWQAFLNDANLSNVDFKIPGVLYSWSELKLNARFSGLGFWVSTLRWMRFVGFPVIAMGILGVVHMNSARALRLALGEEKPAGE